MRVFITEFYVDDKRFRGDLIYAFSKGHAESQADELGISIVGELEQGSETLI